MAKKYKDPTSVSGLKKLYTDLKVDFDSMPSFAPAKNILKNRLHELKQKIQIAEAFEENNKTPLKRNS